jgi:hypothetical protein
MSLGGSSQKSSSSGSSIGFGEQASRTYLNPFQQQAQQQLIGDYQASLQPFGQRYQPMTNDLLGRNLAMTSTAPTAGMNQLNQFAQQGNPFLQQSIDQFGQNLSDQFGRTVQQIGGNAQLAGQRGSSRQGIAEGMAFEEMLDTYGQGVTALQSDAYNQQQAAAGQYAMLEQQQRAQAAQAAQAGLAGIGQAYQNYFSPFQIGAGIIGAPQILSDAYGYDFRAAEQESKGSGGSFDIGFS